MTLDLPVPTYAHYLALHALVVVLGILISSGVIVILSGLAVLIEEWSFRRTLNRIDYQRAEAREKWLRGK